MLLIDAMVAKRDFPRIFYEQTFRLRSQAIEMGVILAE